LAVLVATIFVPLGRAIRMLALVIAFVVFRRIFFQQSNAKSEDSADFLIG